MFFITEGLKMTRTVVLAIVSLTLAGCCCNRPRPKVEHCLKVGLAEKAPYVNPPDITAEMGWKW